MFKQHAAQEPKAAGIRVTTSVYGQVIPMLYGRGRLAPRLIDSANFQARKGHSGKKGKKSGKKGGDYTYYTADLTFLLAHYPLQLALSLYVNKDEKYRLATATVAVTAGSGGTASLSGQVPGGNDKLVAVLAVRRRNIAYSETFSDYGDPAGSRSFSGTRSEMMENQAYRRPAYITDNDSSSFLNYSVGGLNISTATGGDLLDVTFAYAVPQKGWNGIPTSKFGQTFQQTLLDRELTFPDISGIYAPNTDLGVADMVPSFQYECLGHLPFGNLDGDCNPADVLLDMLFSGAFQTAPTWKPFYHGLNLSTDSLNAGQNPFAAVDVAAMRAYCQARNLAISCAMDAQKTASDWLQEIFDIANCAPVYSGQTFKAVPYDEQSIATATGIYTAATAAGPVYDLTTELADGGDILGEPGTPPVTVSRERQADAFNALPIEYTDRVRDYAAGTVVATAHSEIGNYGTRRASPKQYPMIHNSATALQVGAILLRRNGVSERVKYLFKLSLRMLLLEPMDLVTLTDPLALLNKAPARLTRIVLNDKNELECEAEPFIFGLNTPAILNAQGSLNLPPDVAADPGLVNPPYFLEPLPALTGATAKPELWIAVTGGANYGGCQVWMSIDGGSEYTLQGVLVGQSSQGEIYSADFTVTGDPDTSVDCFVDLNQSGAQLTSVDPSVTDAFQSLIALDGGGSPATIPYELIGYQTVALQAAGQYKLDAHSGSQIRRGAFSTPIVQHNIGATVVVLDGTLFKIALDPALIGTELHFKFPAFNPFMHGLSARAECDDYTYTPTGLNIPTDEFLINGA